MKKDKFFLPDTQEEEQCSVCRIGNNPLVKQRGDAKSLIRLDLGLGNSKSERILTASFVSSGRMAPSPQNLGLLLVYFLSFLFGLPANLLALRAFVGRVRRPHPAPVHILLLSLALADLLLLPLPFKMVEAAHNFAWPLGNTLCALTGFGFYSSISCCTWLLVGISVERYRSVAFPVQYKLHRRPVFGVIAAVAIRLLSCGHCSVVIIVQHLPTNSSREANSRPVC